MLTRAVGRFSVCIATDAANSVLFGRFEAVLDVTTVSCSSPGAAFVAVPTLGPPPFPSMD